VINRIRKIKKNMQKTERDIRKKQRGAVLLLTFMVMVALISITVGFLYMISVRARSSGHDIKTIKAFWFAEAGLKAGGWAIESDREASYQTSDPSANGYCDEVFLEGYQVSGSTGQNFDRACFHGTSFTSSTPYYAQLLKNSNAELQVYDFQQRCNLLGTRIKKIEIAMRARKDGTAGTNPEIQLQYSTDGGATWVSVGAEIEIDNSSWGSESYRYVEITPVPQAWSYFVNSNGTDLRIRANRMNGGDRVCWIDWLSFRVTVEVDALTEPWGSGSYLSFPYTLGDGTIQSVTIADESSKLHLNYAGETVLQYLAEECGFSTAQAQAFAQRAIAYRAISPFNTIDEVMELQGATTDLFDMIKDYITVYSWANDQVTRPTGTRAPVNINTADVKVLKAILRTTLTVARANALADYIVNRRATQPFTHMASTYSYQDLDIKSFLYTLVSLDGTSDRVLRVSENADASYYNRDRTQSWNGNDELATEFCYYTNTFLITATGENNNIQRTIRTTYGDTYDYVNFYPNPTAAYALPAYVGDTPKRYWREVR
jgi:hypothetical protein